MLKMAVVSGFWAWKETLECLYFRVTQLFDSDLGSLATINDNQLF